MAGIIEAGARALALAQSGVDEFDALDEGFRETLRENVRAVLRAIREPTDHMLISGRAPLPEHDEPLLEDAENCWQAMIDAALAEGQR